MRGHSLLEGTPFPFKYDIATWMEQIEVQKLYKHIEIELQERDWDQKKFTRRSASVFMTLLIKGEHRKFFSGLISEGCHVPNITELSALIHFIITHYKKKNEDEEEELGNTILPKPNAHPIEGYDTF